MIQSRYRVIFSNIVLLLFFSSCKESVNKTEEIKKGTIIFLHGISSVGKTSTARKLQNLLDVPYLYLGIDTFSTMLPEYLVNFNPETYKTNTRALEDGVTFEPIIHNGKQLFYC